MMQGIRKVPRRSNNAVLLYMQEEGARVVAKSGVPSDRFHLGKLILQRLKDDPNFVLQIDGALNVSETNGSVLQRSIRCSLALRSLGLKCGDVMVIIAPNHLDLTVPLYAALYLGICVAGVDMTLGVHELKTAFEVNKPKIVFCQNHKTSEVEIALEKSNTSAHIVIFGKTSTKGINIRHFSEFLGDNITSTEIEDFKPADFDATETIAFLTATSGTTGLPKSAALTHKNQTIGLIHFIARYYEYPTPTRLYFFISPLQWLSAGLAYTMSAIMKYTRLQTSEPFSKDHVYDLINTYKPSAALFSPNLMSTLLNPADRDRCDFSCFEVILLAGSQVTQAIVDDIRMVSPLTEVDIGYGLSETSGLCFSWDAELPSGSVGRPIGHLKHRLIDVTSLQDIEKPNVVGELWVQGPTVFKGYYKNSQETKEAFAEDGWLKTGDLFYRDQYYNFFFVDRLKILLKYRNHQISPAEVEMIIRQLPGVQDAVVVGVPDEECGDLPAAAVVREKGATVTAQEIKDWVKENLADTKQLRGGVVFMDELPMTVTTKVDRMKLKMLVPKMERE